MDSISHDAVVSAANLLLVSLLKLNRAFVPIILHLVRGRRTNWINRASEDVYADLRAGTNTRDLCVRHCCAKSYELEADESDVDSDGKFDDDGESEDSEDWDRRERGVELEHSVMPTNKKHVSKQSGIGSEGSDVTQAKDHVQVPPTSTAASVSQKHPQAAPSRNFQVPQESSGKRKGLFTSSEQKELNPVGGFKVPSFARVIIRRSLGMKLQEEDEELEHYIRLLVTQEEKHRRQRIIPTVYQSVLTGWITIIALVAYSSAILVITRTYFPMEAGQFISFSFSLVATATVSEADKLMQVVKRRKPNMTGALTSTTTSALRTATQKRRRKSTNRLGRGALVTDRVEIETTEDYNIAEIAPILGDNLDIE